MSESHSGQDLFPSNRSVLGDRTKARTHLGWETECGFENLVKEMVESDLTIIKGSVTYSASRAVDPILSSSFGWLIMRMITSNVSCNNIVESDSFLLQTKNKVGCLLSNCNPNLPTLKACCNSLL
jgi:hypothetical protein